MSLILEALRKSEAERRRGAVPDLFQGDAIAPPPARSSLRPWWFAAPLLLLVPLLWWWTDGIEDAPVAHAAQTVAPTPQHAAPDPDVAPAGRALPEIDRLQAPAQPTTEVPALAPPAPAAETVSHFPATATPTRLSALPPERRRALPPLRLSLHLWNEDPARRVAIVDGRRVAVGDRAGDARVAEIRRDGVLLDWQGETLLVPLP